jgi:hypothetical protein
MDWIERIFNLSPDAGNGSLELLFVFAPAAAVLVGFLGALWFRKRRHRRADRH